MNSFMAGTSFGVGIFFLLTQDIHNPWVAFVIALNLAAALMNALVYIRTGNLRFGTN